MRNPAGRAGHGLTGMRERAAVYDGTITAGPDLLRRIADQVYERASASGELVATDLPSIYREFPEFTASTNWLGFNSLRSMTWGVVHARPDLAMVDGDPWKVRVRPGAERPVDEAEWHG